MGLLPAGLQAVFSCDTEFQFVLAFGKYLACFDAFAKDRCSESFIGVIVRVWHGKRSAVPIFASYILDGQSRHFDSLDAFSIVKGNDLTKKTLVVLFLDDDTERPKTVMLGFIMRPDVIGSRAFQKNIPLF